MTKTEPAFTYKRAGFSFTVYDNRIDVQDKSGFGAIFGGKKQTILLRNVSSVEVEGVRKHLTIRTNDGKQETFNLGAKSGEARETILSML